MRTTRCFLGGVTAVLLLAAAGAPAATRREPPPAADGAKRVGAGTEPAGTGAGRTVADAGKKADKRPKGGGHPAKAVGDRLHDSAKAFGEALLDGLRHVARTVHRFVTGDR